MHVAIAKDLAWLPKSTIILEYYEHSKTIQLCMTTVTYIHYIKYKYVYTCAKTSLALSGYLYIYLV